MKPAAPLLLRPPECVGEGMRQYRDQVQRFLAGVLAPAAFCAYHVPIGIHEEKQAGRYMVRIRIGAGLASSAQLRCIAQLSQKHGNGIVHMTTRQDMQIHGVQLAQTPDVLEGLWEAGLSSRGGGGNTIRNITACPRAGVCPCEQFNVVPHAMALAQRLLQRESSCHLPHKFTIAFSGCSADCALASAADLGFFAHRRNGMRGFAVYAGGGLGDQPAVAVEVEEFIEEHEIFEVAEAVKRLFETYGDRSNRQQARLRHVLIRFGREEFARLYRKERARVRRQGLEGAVPEIARKAEGSNGEIHPAEPKAQDALPEKNKGLYTFKLILPYGNISAEDLTQVAQMAETCGTGIIRTTQQQDLLIPSVPKAQLEPLRRQAQHLRISTSAGGMPKVVVCAGASTCKFAACRSRGLAEAIADALSHRPVAGAENITLRISGCPNSCSQHPIGELGFQGRAQEVNGRLMPCYDVFAEARIVEGAARLAETVGTLPARRIPEFVVAVLGTGALTADRLRHLVEEYAQLPPGEIPEDYYRDWGPDSPVALPEAAPDEPIQPLPAPEAAVHTVDLRGIPCPLNFVKAKLALEKAGVGDILDIEIDDGESIRNLPVSLGRQGQEILATIRRENYFCLKVRRKL